MLLRSLSFLNDRHVVTAGEAAYNQLLGTFARNCPGGYWASAAAVPGRTPWRITLYSLQSHIASTAGLLRAGYGVKLLELVESESDPVVDIVSGFQAESGKIAFSGERPIDYGFGVVYWATLTAGDVIFTRASYVVRLP